MCPPSFRITAASRRRQKLQIELAIFAGCRPDHRRLGEFLSGNDAEVAQGGLIPGTEALVPSIDIAAWREQTFVTEPNSQHFSVTVGVLQTPAALEPTAFIGLSQVSAEADTWATSAEGLFGRC